MTPLGTKRTAAAIGAGAAAVSAVAYLLGLFEPIDRYNLDLHFRHFNTIQADPRIVLIDIDDSTLAAMPNWPWPRRVFADLVRTLNELGPRAIVLDIIFDQASTPRIEHAGLDRNYDFGTSLPEIGDRAFDEVVYDDDELREAMARAGNVYLPMPARIGLSKKWLPDGHRLLVEIEEAPPFDCPRPTSEGHLSAFMPDIETPERELAVRTNRSCLGWCAATARFAPTPVALRRLLVPAVDQMPPLEKLGCVAKGVGLVSFNRTTDQASVRELPLVADSNGDFLGMGGVSFSCGSGQGAVSIVEGRLVSQLGVVVANDLLGIGPSPTSLADGRWVFGRDAARRAVGLGAQWTSLVNWHRPSGPDWRSSFHHLPALRPLEVVQNCRAIADNFKRLGLSRAELVKARHADTPGEYVRYVKLVNERLELKRRNRGSAPSDPSQLTEQGGANAKPALEKLDVLIEAEENEAAGWIQRAWGLWKETGPQNEEENSEKIRIKALYDRFSERGYVAWIAEANTKLEQRNQELLAELGPQLRDKICLVGYTATAMADMVPTPVDPAMPGVMVHANVINMFLQDRFASAAPVWLNALIIMATGLLTTFFAARGSPKVSVVAVVMLSLAVIALGAALFYAWTYHLAAFAAVVCLLFVWAAVTVYRQATEERTRRQLQRALAQYTSPAVASRIVETARAEGLAPRVAEVSCFFSDLAGFTALSEQLGPQRTRDLLNPYLREVSGVILRHNGMVNKFIGDGVFAFFNAPLLPCAKHADAACRAALDATRAASHPLQLRIGLSTGEAFVGDYGSDMKLDYTCIGDTVNVAERLERAGKALGTTILVDDETRRQAGSDLVFRSLGRIEVPGRTAAVAVHELVGTDGQVQEAQRRGIAQFEEAVRCFQTCQWDSCLALLAECRRLRPTDAALHRYEAAIDRLRDRPPPNDWNGALSIIPL